MRNEESKIEDRRSKTIHHTPYYELVLPTSYFIQELLLSVRLLSSFPLLYFYGVEVSRRFVGWTMGVY